MSNLAALPVVLRRRVPRWAGALLAALAVSSSVGADAQADWPENPWEGDGDFNDLWKPHQSGRIDNPIGRPVPPDDAPKALRGRPSPVDTVPQGLRLSFDEKSQHVLVEWKRPKLGYYMTNYQLRMRKGDSAQWGRWQEVGSIGPAASFVFIHSVDPGATYEVEVRTRNDRIAGLPASGTVTIPEPPAPS